MTVKARWTLLFAAYFVVQALLRLLIGPALELDEAEVFFHARTLAWGYGPQPPLYWWLQWGVFQVLGETLLALAALKAALLAGTLVLVLRLLRPEVGPAAAGAAALALGFLPQVVWESQRALANTVLVLLMAVAFALALVRALDAGRRRDHVLLGVVAALGLLSKYNFAISALALIAAAAVLPEWRRRLQPGKLLGSVALALGLIAPVLLWAWRNLGLATASVGKFEIAGASGIMVPVAGTGAVLEAALGFLALPAVGLGAVALLVRRRTGLPLPRVARLLGFAAVSGLALVWLGVLAVGATEVRDRWLTPVAWALVPVAVVWLWPRLAARGRRWLVGAAGALWLLAAAALPYASLVDPGYRGADFGPLVAALAGEERPVVVADQWVAGNLAFAAPDLDVQLLGRRPNPAGAALLVVAPEDLDAALGALGPGVTPGPATGAAVPMARRDLRLAVVPLGP